MGQDDEKLYLYVNMSWLKAFVLLILTVIIPYNLVLFLLLKVSVLSGPVWNVLSMGGSFAIAFVWAFIRKHKAAKKEQ